MNFRHLLPAAIMSCLAFGAYAIPANPAPVQFRQADGSIVTVTLHGDEHFSWYETADGHILQFYSDDLLGYVTLDASGNTRIVETPARNAEERTESERALLGSIDRDAVATAMRSEMQAATRRFAARKLPNIGGIMTNYPTIGSPKALVLLVEYQDEKFHTENANEEFNKLMNEKGYSYNGATGSALDYFTENSNGLFTPEFDVYGPITLPNTMAYYGASSGNAKDSRPWEMMSDGCQLLKEQHPEIDFNDYDNDGDGVVDNVFIFFAGYGQNSGASSNTVWPHAAQLTWYMNVSIDGVMLDSYACTNELNGNSGKVRTGIGTFCHEFSHVLGLPDLYATDGSTCFTPGSWELMDIGPYNNNGNTPPYMSAFDRYSVRWLQPRELTAPETVTLNPIGTSNEAFFISTIEDFEFFLLENRQQTGWDAYIPGHGMLVWHVDYDKDIWERNKVNNSNSHQCVDIIEADNIRTNATQAGDPFPGIANVTSLTDDTNPSLATWTGIRVAKPITDIQEISGIISFKILGGGDGVPTVKAIDPKDVGPVSFKAAWEGNPTASGYEIDVFKGMEPLAFATYSCQPKSLEECFFEVAGLTPDTDYSYEVRAVDGNMKSANSNRIQVRTAVPTFDMLQVSDLHAEDVNGDAFTAAWTPLADADGYELNVYTKTFNQPVYDVVDFTGGISELPDGWSTVAGSVSSVAGTYGEARPALALKVDGDDLVSPVYDQPINSVTFWCSSSSDADATLSLEAWNGVKWTAYDVITFSGKSEGKTLEYSDQNANALKNGATRVRFTLHRTAGTVYLDDVKVAYNGSATFNYVKDFEKRACSENECRVTGLEKETLYYYTVQGTKGGERSLLSEEKNVKTGTQAAVESVSADSTVAVVAADGAVRVYNGTGKPVQVTVADMEGRVVAEFTVSSGWTARNLPTGVYAVKAGSIETKLMVK